MATGIHDSYPFEVIGPIYAHRSEAALWRDGTLKAQWAEKYPEIFDEDDNSFFRRQPTRHYFEAYAAIWWRSQGYYSLIERYDNKTPKHKHPRKAHIFHQLVSSSQYERWWAAKKAYTKTGPPDLLLYKPDLSDWFLCEVKGPTDWVRQPQRSFWLELENILGKRVRVLHVEWSQEVELDQTQKAQQCVAPYVAQGAPSGER